MVRGQHLLTEGERLQSQSRSKKISQHASVLFGFDRQKANLRQKNINAMAYVSLRIFSNLIYTYMFCA